MQNVSARLIAFYLPQFHPIPENDAWWGKGFTEWTYVTRARPLFRGHRQPCLPSDFGFYDLRVPEVRDMQAQLAREHGIEGFCYWHYWFHGKRLLNRPVDEVLATGKPDFPFCLSWANESWSRTWMGEDKEILVEQRYSAEDDIAHARWLARVFADPRYIRVGSRPLFLIYRPQKLPDPRATTDRIRHEVVRLGLAEPYLVGINAHSYMADMREWGFDMTEHHEPQLSVLPGAFSTPSLKRQCLTQWRRLRGCPPKVYSFADARRRMDAIRPKHPHFPAYFIGWDNTARRGKEAIIIRGAAPDVIGAGLRTLLADVVKKPAAERIVFLNAWNEWAEGMYLEPDQDRGTALLEAVRGAVTAVSPEMEETGCAS